MFAVHTFGGSYFGQGPPGIQEPPPAATEDAMIHVRGDVGGIRVRPDLDVQVRSDPGIIEP